MSRTCELTGKSVMTGNNVSAEDAYRMGLANHICEPEDLENKTMQIAQTKK